MPQVTQRKSDSGLTTTGKPEVSIKQAFCSLSVHRRRSRRTCSLGRQLTLLERDTKWFRAWMVAAQGAQIAESRPRNVPCNVRRKFLKTGSKRIFAEHKFRFHWLVSRLDAANSFGVGRKRRLPLVRLSGMPQVCQTQHPNRQ